MRLLFLLLTFCALVTGGCASQGTDLPHASFIAEQGGLLPCGAEVDRAQIALNRVQSQTLASPNCTLSIHVLNSDNCVAFSFPDGSIFVADGLVSRLSDNELAACIAHEMGHMLHDGILRAPAALNGCKDGGGDIERAADLLGTQVLRASNIPTDALPSALEKVAAVSRGTGCYEGLCERILYLRSLPAVP